MNRDWGSFIFRVLNFLHFPLYFVGLTNIGFVNFCVDLGLKLTIFVGLLQQEFG